MNLLPFKHKDFQRLHDLLIYNKCTWTGTVSYKTLPKIGYFAELNGTMVAAGFLRRVEGGYGQLDTFVTNSHLGGLVRHEGIELVTKSLLDEAKALKLLGIIAISKDLGILGRARRLGFVEVHQSIVCLELRK